MAADLIIRNGRVITCDPAHRAGDLALLLRDGRIAEVSESADALTTAAPGARVVDAAGKLILPGFVNAHVHLESILFRVRTAGRHAGLWEKDAQVTAARTRLAAPEGLDDLRLLTLGSCFEHLRHGTTTVGDFPPDVQERGLIQILQAVDRSDLRIVMALLNWDQIRQARDLGPRRPPFLVHLGREEDLTVYSFENAVRTAAEFEVPLLAHLAERREDADLLRKNFQKSPLTVLRDFGALRHDTLLAHLNYLDETDLDLLEASGATAALCAQSALFKQTGYPSLRGLLGRRIRLCLGTDWGRTDMLAEMRFVLRLPLFLNGLPRLTALEVLRMATINGAHALGLGSETGSLERGKRADLVFLQTDRVGLPTLPEAPTAEELADWAISGLSGRDVNDVMIGGEFYLRDGQIMTMSEEDILAGMNLLHRKHFPRETRKPRAVKARVLPLVFDSESAPDTPGVLELGGPALPAEESPDSVNLEHPQSPPAAPPQGDSRTGSLPELSKNVRRTFGDDEF
jgi:5-methylthioadenosine/S-adenosylhomocysteine deaminase